MREYALVTEWRLDAPIERVWAALAAPRDWPSWWRYVHSVEELEPGDADGVGALRRFTWTSRLPYRLAFDMRSTVVKRPERMEGVASGDLDGSGRWRLRAEGRTTTVRYEWTVTTGRSWMNLFAPLLAPVFAWNHDQVMREGGRGLARHLGVELLGFTGTGEVRRAQR